MNFTMCCRNKFIPLFLFRSGGDEKQESFLAVWLHLHRFSQPKTVNVNKKELSTVDVC